MSAENPKNTPEKKEILDDNARKFITDPIDPHFLKERKASSFTLTVNWLETGDDNEVKVAHKKFDDGRVQILLIAKVTKDGNRTSVKEEISEEEYRQLIDSPSKIHLEKKRYEFKYEQNGITFSVKYDKFSDSDLCILEVDASSEEERISFNSNDFPNTLNEVTGDMQYYGYRMAHQLEAL